MEWKEEYDEYTLGLALMDFLPVISFLMSGLVMYSMYGSPILLAGVLASFTGGLCKAVWKLIIVKRKKDRAWMTRAFRVLMPAGFALMILSVAAGGRAALAGLWRSLTMMPAAILFAAGILLLCLMGYLGAHMDGSAKSNWTEELVNTLAQLAILAGVIAVYFGTYYHADASALEALRGVDGVSVSEITQEADGLWPDDFTEVVIKGGNHAQFGNYGEQKGDGSPAITAAAQQKETVDAIIAW